MTKYVVTEMGPIDRKPPGTDVTNDYPADVMERLVEEGYVTEDVPDAPAAAAKKPARKRKTTKKVSDGE